MLESLIDSTFTFSNDSEPHGGEDATSSSTQIPSCKLHAKCKIHLRRDTYFLLARCLIS